MSLLRHADMHPCSLVQAANGPAAHKPLLFHTNPPPSSALPPPHLLARTLPPAPAGKPVYFEAAVERFKDFDLLASGFYNSMLAGADNIGITNWHTRVDMNASLTKVGRRARGRRARGRWAGGSDGVKEGERAAAV